mgnify:CR=1 FL=1
MDELVKKAQHGDKEAFTELILLLKADLYKIAKTRIKNDEDIYDAIQETMIIAFNSIKKLKKIESFKSWIIKILINTSNNLYKKTSKNNTISLEKVEAYSSLNYSDYDKVETILDFNFILKNFKYEDRIIIILYYMEKFTDKEIGEILKLKENTVKTKRTRIKEHIKEIFKEGGQELYGPIR